MPNVPHLDETRKGLYTNQEDQEGVNEGDLRDQEGGWQDDIFDKTLLQIWYPSLVTCQKWRQKSKFLKTNNSKIKPQNQNFT